MQSKWTGMKKNWDTAAGAVWEYPAWSFSIDLKVSYFKRTEGDLMLLNRNVLIYSYSEM